MIALLCLCTWLYLFLAHGRFWRSAPELAPVVPGAPVSVGSPVVGKCPPDPAQFPDVDVLVPARDEARTVGAVTASLLAQHYPGHFHITLIDDDSRDGTARAAGASPRLTVLTGTAKPAGWSGKLWALQQGIAATGAPLLLLTDADIVHDPRHLATLVATLTQPPAGGARSLDLVSEMVRLRCVSLPERMLVPAFVYFFQLLYPFARVNDPHSRVAAAAGGTILLRRAALERSGGLEAIKGALIDDVSLARRIKAGGPLYLGHSGLAASIRPYPDFASIWQMIARTAFTQLRHSAWLLAGTVTGLAWVFLVPVGEVILEQGWRRAAAAAAVALGALTYMPTLRRYRRSPLWTLGLPLIAVFYVAATVGSAVDHWRGAGVRWKRRAYEGG